MGIEIERKFLVKDSSWKTTETEGLVCRQGYLCTGEGTSVRVRIMGHYAYLTIKGPTNGISRSEFEYDISLSDAEAMLAMCGNLVEKVRYFVGHGGRQWELDVFSGANEGLVMAEIELESEDQPFDMPDWAGEEVSGDVRYYNGYLARNPYTQWSNQCA